MEPGEQHTDVPLILQEATLISNHTDRRSTRKPVGVNVAQTYSELVVDFVDVFVDPAVMQQAMEEVVPGVFNNCTTEALSQEIRPGRRERGREKVSELSQQNKQSDLNEGPQTNVRLANSQATKLKP